MSLAIMALVCRSISVSPVHIIIAHLAAPTGYGPWRILGYRGQILDEVSLSIFSRQLTQLTFNSGLQRCTYKAYALASHLMPLKAPQFPCNELQDSQLQLQSAEH